jgi:hypothetical protein
MSAMDTQDELKRIPTTAPKSRGGQWVTLGEEAYRIPPLGFLAIQELADEVQSLAKMGDRPTPEQMGTVTKIVHAAISRNYPYMTVQELADMLDIGNYQRVLGEVLQIAGFKQESGGPGEGQASTGTGASSTPA